MSQDNKILNRYSLYALILILIVSILGFCYLVYIIRNTPEKHGESLGSKATKPYTEAEEEALGIYSLKEGEFAVIKTEGKSSLSEPVISSHLLSSGQVFEVKADKDTTIEILEGNRDVQKYISRSSIGKNTTIHTYDELDVVKDKVDSGILRKLKDQDVVPVIIQMEMPFKLFYEKGDGKDKKEDKKVTFKEIKNKVASDIKDKSKVKMDLEIIGAISADIDESALKKLQLNKSVKKIELDRPVKAVIDHSVSQIKADQVWGLIDVQGRTITGEGQIIAIIDTGVDYKHPDLGGCFGPGCKVVGGYDCYSGDNDPMDDNGHGTHVAATAAGKGNSGSQLLYGVAPDAKILAYKVLGAGGSGMVSTIICGINRATADGATVASMSLGGAGNPDDSGSMAVDNSSAAGVVHSIAAGNNGPGLSTVSSPGVARSAVTVSAACKPADIGVDARCSQPIASFSSRGPVIYNGVDYKKPDISAPGVSICAAKTAAASYTNLCFDTSHARISGTSMATPHIAGVLALIRQAYPGHTPEMVKALVKSSAIDLGMDYNAQGSGLIDLKKAIPVNPKVTFNPIFWSLTNEPTVKSNIFKQSITVGKIDPGVSLLNISFENVPNGLTINTDKQTLDFSQSASNSLNIEVAVDNDILKAGSYPVNIVFSQDNVKKGIFTTYVTAKPSLQVNPTSEIDFGINNPALTQWRSEIKTLEVKNLRTDVSQNAKLLYSPTVAGINMQYPTTLNIGPGGTASADISYIVDNAQVSNDIFSGLITVTGINSSQEVKTKFAKYYALIIHDPSSNDIVGVSSSIWIHNRTDQQYILSATTNPTTIYLNSSGLYDIIVAYPYSPIGTYSVRHTVIKEGINLDPSIGKVTVQVQKSDAKNKVQTLATDSDGVVQEPLQSKLFSLVYKPNSSLYYTGHTMTVGNLSLGMNYISNFSTNYQSNTYYTWPPFQMTSKVHYYKNEINGVQDRDVIATNQPSDFKIFNIKYDVDNQSGLIYPRIWDCTPISCHAFTTSAIGLQVPATQQIYSLRPDTKYPYFVDHSNSVSTYVDVGPRPVRYYYPNLTAPLPLLHLDGNTMYYGLGPAYWSSRVINTGTTSLLQHYIPYSGALNPFQALERQDFVTMPYDSFKLDYFKDGNMVTSLTVPPFNGLGVGWGSGTLGSVSLPSAGKYEARAEFPYKNKGIQMSGKVSISFDTSLTDKNPPAFKRFYYYSNNVRSEIYDPAADNKLVLEVDPIGGSVSGVKVSYSTDGNVFSPSTVTQEAAAYVTTLPKVQVDSKITVKVEAFDDSSNSLSYIFELPKGVAAAPTDPITPPARDTEAPKVSITNPVEGAGVSGSVPVEVIATDNVGVTKVIFYINGNEKLVDTEAPYSYTWDTSTYTNGSNSISASAFDAESNTATASVSVNLANGDTQAPTAPSTLASSSVSYNKVDLSWTASTDNIGVAGYYVMRNESNIATVSTGTTYSDASVLPSTVYNYYVVAFDKSSNNSLPSNKIEVTTPTAPDTTPPSAPSNLTGSGISTQQINISWNASTDNVGVKGYEVYRNGSKVSTVTTTSYGDTGLTASTSYDYYVLAFDASGNKSPNSNTVTVKTLDDLITTGSVEGTVTSSQGGVLSGVKVRIKVGKTVYQSNTNAQGFYTLQNIPGGTYSIEFRLAKYVLLTESLTVTPAVTTVKNVTLQKN